jgi:molecular chaperone GrpE
VSDEDKRRAEDSEEAASSQAPEADASADGADDDELTVDDILAEAGDDGQAAGDTAKLLQSTLEERTRDLQRLSAEYQNYRRRVERDKVRAAEMASAGLLSALLPVLDDLDRAREHGDLNGPFAAVAEQLTNVLTKQGLEPFGEKGDAFDPTIHEAVAHMQMADVDGPTCIDVMRRGYRIGDRLLRAALVAVAEPFDEEPPVPEAGPEAEEETPEAELDEAAEPGVEPEPEGAVEPAEDADDDASAEAASEADAETEQADEESADASGGDAEATAEKDDKK